MERFSWRQFDLMLVLTALALVGLGLTLIYSGSLVRYGGDEPILSAPVTRQIAYAALGVLFMLALARIDYRNWSAAALPLYGLAILALILVFVIGTSAHGSRRWFVLGSLQLQPSEPAKLITILLLARYLAEAGANGVSGRLFLGTMALTAIPAGLVFIEPDLGTAVVFGSIWFGMVFMAGARLRHLGLLVGAALAALPFAALVALKGYQRERIAVFLDPERDPLGTGFNINQAAISIGSGGWSGKGLTQGTQTQLDFLRTQTTDYIFSVLGEELGFVGAMVLFLLFIILLTRGLRIASRARDPFGRLVASGIVVMILTQIFINIGVNVRLFPVTGIPLPFISQGGSSLMSMFMALGILQSIAIRRRQSRGWAAPGQRLLLPET